MGREAVRTIISDSAPSPAGHYSEATISGGLLFISGPLPMRCVAVAAPDARFDAQARQAIANILSILEAAGLPREDLAGVTAYTVGISQWDSFDTIFAEMLPEVRPARTVVPVSELHRGSAIELDAIAAVGNQ